MKDSCAAAAEITLPASGELVLSGLWTALGMGRIEARLSQYAPSRQTALVIDGAGVDGLDSAGVWMLQRFVQRWRAAGHSVQWRGWSPSHVRLLELVARHRLTASPRPAAPGWLAVLGGGAIEAGEQALALLGFIGQSAIALAGCIAQPSRLRWRPVLHNIRSAGFDALPIVALLSFLLGVVIAYQAADQLRQYGANIFVADLVGLSMLREFAPLMTAIIVAGRSGSAYAAQIGTMAVTEEIDAMQTLGIVPIDLLVLPKIIALMIALPLLTFFADVLGVFGGMVSARAQLDVGFADFLDRFVKAVNVSAYLIGIGKAPVFAAIIVVVGCFQGFQTRGGAESVGRQTTRSVVQSIFLVIVADALFSVLFSLAGL
jgi:phospholipid/cholesterol/gamma-HCH transport system permease protein